MDRRRHRLVPCRLVGSKTHLDEATDAVIACRAKSSRALLPVSSTLSFTLSKSIYIGSLTYSRTLLTRVRIDSRASSMLAHLRERNDNHHRKHRHRQSSDETTHLHAHDADPDAQVTTRQHQGNMRISKAADCQLRRHNVFRINIQRESERSLHHRR